MKHVRAVFCSLGINLFEKFVTTQNKMIATQILITNGSNPKLLASSITATFVNRHRTQFPRIPSGCCFLAFSYWYGHNFLPKEWCVGSTVRFTFLECEN